LRPCAQERLDHQLDALDKVQELYASLRRLYGENRGDVTEEAFCARFLRFVAEFVKSRQQWEVAHGVEKDANKPPSAAPSPAADAPALTNKSLSSPAHGVKEEGEEGGMAWREKLGASRRLRRVAPRPEGGEGGNAGGNNSMQRSRKADPVRPNVLFKGWGSSVTEGPRDEEYMAMHAASREEQEARAREAGDGGEVMNQAVQELKAAVTAELSSRYSSVVASLKSASVLGMLRGRGSPAAAAATKVPAQKHARGRGGEPSR